MKIIHIDCSKKDIPNDIYNWCRKNNYHLNRVRDYVSGGGLMYNEIETSRNLRSGHIFIAEDNGKYVGWAIVSRVYNLGTRKINQFQCYVPISLRRNGIGTKLLKRATLKLGPVNVIPHNDVAKMFFNANGSSKNDNISGKKLKRK